MGIASGFYPSGDSVSSTPSYTPGTPSSPPSQDGLMLMPTGAISHHPRERSSSEVQTAAKMALASGFCPSGESASSKPLYTPCTPSSPPSQYGLMLMPTGAPFFLGFGVGGEHYGYYEGYTPSSPPPTAGSSLDYSPSSLLPCAGSPDYTPSEPSTASPYTPSTPPSQAVSLGYKPSTPTSSLLVSDAESRMLPDNTPITPSSSLVSDTESPDYTPSTPTSRAGSPDYTTSTPPGSPALVSDAESRRRHHPYQRSSASTCSSRSSRISPSRHQRALRYY